MKSFNDLYKFQLDYNIERMPYVGNFLKNPYSYLKARYYMFFSTLVVYFLQNTSIHPNTITKVYIFWGFLAALFLAIPIHELHFLAIFLFFSKGILDWADGFFARLKQKTSLTGHVLDVYGAAINSLAFVISLGIYNYYLFGENALFLFTLFIYPFCYGTLLTKFSNNFIIEEINTKNLTTSSNKSNFKTIKESHSGIYNFFTIFLDDRSRTIDFVLFLILVEQYGGPHLSWLFYLGVNLKWLALWFGSFIFSSKERYADDLLSSKLNELKNG